MLMALTYLTSCFNELGIKNRQWDEEINNKGTKQNLDFEKVRKKITKKNMLKNHAILESFTKSIKE